MEPNRKAARQELRKAQTLDILAEVCRSQETHGHALNEFQDALAEHTAWHLRMAGSFWARLRWVVVGK